MENTTENVIFEVTDPMHTGEAYRAMQVALNAAGYTDENGSKLDTDGKWGNKSQYAFDSMTSKNVRPRDPNKIRPAVAEFCMKSVDGRYMFKGTVTALK